MVNHVQGIMRKTKRKIAPGPGYIRIAGQIEMCKKIHVAK